MLIHRQDDPEAAHAAETAILSNEKLSYAARGILLRILRHGPEWTINAEGLSELARLARGEKGDSVPTIRAYFREIESAGYLVRTRVRMGGRGYGSQLNFYDTRQVAEEPAEPKLAACEGPVVYVVGQRGSSKVKIGQTKNMAKRMDSYRTHSPVELDVLWTQSGGVALEHVLHQRFKALRIHGEWFDFGDIDPISAIDDFVRSVDQKRIVEMEEDFKKRGVSAVFVWDPTPKSA